MNHAKLARAEVATELPNSSAGTSIEPMRTPVQSPNSRRVLCVFPAYAPAFGTFSHAFRLVGPKAFMPPQGLLLIANYLPPTWPVRFIDENMQRARAADFEWADAVFVSGMHIQPAATHHICRPATAHDTVPP